MEDEGRALIQILDRHCLVRKVGGIADEKPTQNIHWFTRCSTTSVFIKETDIKWAVNGLTREYELQREILARGLAM